MLSEYRYGHSLNVAKAAVELAKAHNGNEKKAYIAGILHDITKELPLEEQLSLMLEHNIELNETQKVSPQVWHQKSGAIFVKHRIGINDENIINAIAHHTTGRAGMSKLEKIVYIADLISEERDYKDVRKIRKMAFKGLNKTMIECLRFSVNSLSGSTKLIDEDTLMAYNYFLLKKKDKNKIQTIGTGEMKRRAEYDVT